MAKLSYRSSCLLLFFPVLFFAMSDDVFAANPVSWYKLDDAVGSTAAIDSSGNGHTGTVNGGGVVWMPSGGIAGGAVKFDGALGASSITGRVDIPTTGMSASAGTVAFWANLTEPQHRGDGRDGGAYFFGSGSSTSNRINIRMDQFNTLLDVDLGNGSKPNILTLSTAVWNHIALVWSGGAFRVYVNGVEQGSSGTGTLSSLYAKAQLGNQGGTSWKYSMDGLLDDVRIYAAALTADEIGGLYGAASGPSPANGASGVSNAAVLSWTAGDGATSHNVYFGTVNPPPSKGGQTAATYNPGGLAYSTVYYWRIDEVKAGGTVVTGVVWSFSTLYPPAKVTLPAPPSSASGVVLTSDLSWTAGSGATSHDVYFGQTNPPPFVINQTASIYDTGTMTPESTYYWRINERNAAGVTTGDIWSFTTVSSKASNPGPANSATGVSITAALNWSAGSGATSHDIYFGTINPPPFKVNQTAATYDAGRMMHNKTYYWRINERNGSGTSTGDLWSFTTGDGYDGDITGNDTVNWSDLEIMAAQWLGSGDADLDGSGHVDNVDFAILAMDWLKTRQSFANSWTVAEQQLSNSINAFLTDPLYAGGYVYPRITDDNGQWIGMLAGHWASGFWGGALWQMYGHNSDPVFRGWAKTWTEALADEATGRNDHEAGFIIFHSFGTGYSIEQDPTYKQTVLTAAAWLKNNLYNPNVGCVRSWTGTSPFQVIVDGMIPIEMIFWASRNGGEAGLYDIAISHSLKTMANNVRPDGSTWQICNYDATTGAVTGKATKNGYSVDTTWSRGHAWAIYGFTAAYRETQLHGAPDSRFLDTAKKVADFYIANVPADYVPYWDFQAPGIPNEERDSSAAAIAANGFLELSTLCTVHEEKDKYWNAGVTILNSLSSPAYLSNGSSMGILLHAVNKHPGGDGLDVSLVVGDYFFLKAISLYEDITGWQ